MNTAGTGTESGVTGQVSTERVVAPAGGPASPAGRGGARATARAIGTRYGLPLVVAGGIIGIWYAISELVLNPYQRFMLPPPHRVLEVGFFTWSNFVPLLDALGITAQVTFTGLAISIVLGVGTATAMSQAK